MEPAAEPAKAAALVLVDPAWRQERATSPATKAATMVVPAARVAAAGIQAALGVVVPVAATERFDMRDPMSVG
jgi:hypothetical protein